MTNHRLMFRTFIVLASSCAALLLGACSEKSEAEKAEEERASVREEKRKRAIQAYQTLSKEYPDHPKAEEARQKAAALDALAPKK